MAVVSIAIVSLVAAATQPGRGARVAVPLYLLWLHLVPHYLLWQVCAWLCLFIKDSRLAEVDSKEQPLPKPSAALQEVFGATFELAEILEVQLNTTDPHPNPNPNPNPNPDPHPNPNPNPNSNPGPDPNPNPSQVELDTNLSLIMLDWYEHKDITARYIPHPHPHRRRPTPPPHPNQVRAQGHRTHRPLDRGAPAWHLRQGGDLAPPRTTTPPPPPPPPLPLPLAPPLALPLALILTLSLSMNPTPTLSLSLSLTLSR